jgi:hypothetical protein
MDMERGAAKSCMCSQPPLFNTRREFKINVSPARLIVQLNVLMAGISEELIRFEFTPQAQIADTKLQCLQDAQVGHGTLRPAWLSAKLR